MLPYHRISFGLITELRLSLIRAKVANNIIRRDYKNSESREIAMYGYIYHRFNFLHEEK